MQVINPLLSKSACSELYKLCQLWQRQCVLLEKVTRCLQLLSTARSSSSAELVANALNAAAVEMSSTRQWEHSEHPKWLAFEVLQRITIRPQQYTVAKQLLDNLGGASLDDEDRGAVLQV